MARRIDSAARKRLTAATRLAECSSCGETFRSLKSPQGRWSKTCSLPCRLDALDRMITVFQAHRRRLAERILRGER